MSTKQHILNTTAFCFLYILCREWPIPSLPPPSSYYYKSQWDHRNVRGFFTFYCNVHFLYTVKVNSSTSFIHCDEVLAGHESEVDAGVRGWPQGILQLSASGLLKVILYAGLWFAGVLTVYRLSFFFLSFYFTASRPKRVVIAQSHDKWVIFNI